MIASGEFDDDDDFNAVFDYGLERILDGIDALIRRKRREARRAHESTPELQSHTRPVPRLPGIDDPALRRLPQSRADQRRSRFCRN